MKKEREYIVLGILVHKKYQGLSYLVSHHGGWPFWEPSEYFDIVDSDILPDWHIKIANKNTRLGNLFCLSGFNELCNNENYYLALLEGEQWALDIYAKKYEEAIEWYEIKPFMTKQISLW